MSVQDIRVSKLDEMGKYAARLIKNSIVGEWNDIECDGVFDLSDVESRMIFIAESHNVILKFKTENGCRLFRRIKSRKEPHDLVFGIVSRARKKITIASIQNIATSLYEDELIEVLNSLVAKGKIKAAKSSRMKTVYFV